jgi:hypothetical protein
MMSPGMWLGPTKLRIVTSLTTVSYTLNERIFWNISPGRIPYMYCI